MRWTTISYIGTMYFVSNTLPTASSSTYKRPQAVFPCTGAHLLSRFTPADFRHSPVGPGQYMVLTMSNHVSTQVMRAELALFQKELEEMMRPSDD